MHALHCSDANSSRLIPLSVSPNPQKQSLYPDGDKDRHQNLTVCSLANCQRSLKISYKSVPKFLRKVANRQTNRQANNDYLHILIGGANYDDLVVAIANKDINMTLTLIRKIKI